MKKKLSERVEYLEKTVGNTHFISGTVWNLEQLGKIIEENNSQNELIKIELRIEREGEWKYELYKYPPII